MSLTTEQDNFSNWRRRKKGGTVPNVSVCCNATRAVALCTVSAALPSVMSVETH
ncbi:hypothetical protein AFLA70_47g003881 [Aspergillus flavus AF70]|nr:hypothetical protein AFLA70_47g003881 [Aspergillus flavus AF70]